MTFDVLEFKVALQVTRAVGARKNHILNFLRLSALELYAQMTQYVDLVTLVLDLSGMQILGN